MKTLTILVTLFLLASCGKSKSIGELVEIAQNHETETHLAGQSGAQIEYSQVTQSSPEIPKKIERSSETNTQLSISNFTSKEQMVCEGKKVSQAINQKIIADRKTYKRLLAQYRSNGELSKENQIEFIKLHMEYRLLGSNNYYYSVTRYSAAEIDQLLLSSARRQQEKSGIPETCTYIVKRDGKYFQTKYEIDSDECETEFLSRAQVISFGMAVAQATLESGWGQSRFAKDGNNFYGLQFRFSDASEVTRRPRCIAANGDRNRCLYKFDNFHDSMLEYYRFLNAGTYQTDFRSERGSEDVSANQSCLDAEKMIEGLTNYAENPKYVQDVRERLEIICKIGC